MKGLTYSKKGYFFKGLGIVHGMIPLGNYLARVVQSDTGLSIPKLTQMDYLAAASFSIMGGVYYLFGHFMHSRELEEHKISLLLEDRINDGKDDKVQKDIARVITS